MQAQPHLFCFGLGYSAHHLALRLLQKGWRVSGTHRNADQCQAEQIYGITSYLFDENLPLENIWDLQTVTHILVSIPPHETMGDIVLHHHLTDIRNLTQLQWMGYLSTTGVYGDHHGNWVDETTPPTPFNARTQRRADAEQAWIKSGLPAHIFRLSGIYGPARNALEQLRNGKAKRIQKDGQYFSRIHVDDIATIIEASMDKPNPPSIYNCADNEPCSQEEVVSYAAQILNLPAPELTPFESTDLSEMAKEFYTQNRRVRNDKIKQELGVTLHYPNYRLGLEALLPH